MEERIIKLGAMDRIWLKVSTLKNYFGQHQKISKRATWLSLRLLHHPLKEILRIDDIYVEISEERKEGRGLAQNWCHATAKLLDLPVLHPRIKSSEHLLYFILSKALMEFWRDFEAFQCYNYCSVIGPIQKEWKSFTLPFFSPLEWNHKSLHIPVEFIKIGNFQKYEPQGRVYASIQIGHHLFFKQVQIFDPRGPGEFREKVCLQSRAISDERLIEIINMMLTSPYFLSWQIRHTAAHAFSEVFHGVSFIQAMPSCNLEPNAIPPRVRFW